MSRIIPLGIIFIISFLIGQYFLGLSFAFTSADEYISHAQGLNTCVSDKCHSQLKKEKKSFQHDPVVSGTCDICHRADVYPLKYGIERDQSIVCNSCHTTMGEKIQSSQFIHGPVQSGDCTACHDPHGSDRKFFLRDTYSELCWSCHNPRALSAGSFVHKPVGDGNCGICHDPHASNYRFRLTDAGANLCLTCHEDMMTDMTLEYTHAPLVQSGCSDCHDPHSGEDRLRLKEPAEQLCFKCHMDKKNEISHYTYKHQPAFEGLCILCHSPHTSSLKYLLRNETDTLCYNCHKERNVWKTMQFRHGPVMQGNCTACHNPHGSDNAYILRQPFPEKFYSAYQEGTYSLCFLCHKEAMVTAVKSITITSFRNGDVNLHALHVNKEKGRTCRACHDVHASNAERHMREEFRFGKADIPLYYFKTETGGRCIPGCHKERGYDRMNMVINEK